MAELLLELFSEEIPAGMQARAGDDLARLVRERLDQAGLEAEAARWFATPRRVGVVVQGLPTTSPARTIERRGPRVDAPPAARDGFMQSLREQHYRLEERDDRKGRVLYALVDEPGRPTRDIVAGFMPQMLAGFSWPKSMRWGEGEARWVRPLHAVLCLLDDAVVPFTFAGISSGDVTWGHRFMAGATPLRVRGFADYRDRLEQAKVVLDGAARERLILEGAREIAARHGLRLREDAGLLAELAGLVEWPVPLLGRIDEDFMTLPPEVLQTSMRTHQRYLALEDEAGRLAPRFITVANIAAPDGGAAIIAGNERVLRARLWDARYFWDLDRKTRLEDRLPALGRMVFHAELGTLEQKARRLERLAGRLAPGLKAHVEHSMRAARLAKADLVTGMVGEFPELQGVMGAHYARQQGETAEVALAIAEHYAPRGPDDSCPTAPVSVAVALADKLDTLAGFFGAGIRPTGSKDPFALRRTALGVIRLVLENRCRVNLLHALHRATGGYIEILKEAGPGGPHAVMEFIADRLKVHLREQGVRHDLIAAVYALGNQTDLVQLVARAQALQKFLATPDGANLLAAYRRATNIVRIEEARDGQSYGGYPAGLTDPAELVLSNALKQTSLHLSQAIRQEDYVEAMRILSGLRQPVDDFFDAVMVNVAEPELRINRLRLLSLIRASLHQVADFTLIEDAGVPAAT